MSVSGASDAVDFGLDHGAEASWPMARCGCR